MHKHETSGFVLSATALCVHNNNAMLCCAVINRLFRYSNDDWRSYAICSTWWNARAQRVFCCCWTTHLDEKKWNTFGAKHIIHFIFYVLRWSMWPISIKHANHSFSFALNRNEKNPLSNGKIWPFLMFFSLKFTNIHSKISNFICETSCTIGTYISVEHFTPNTMRTRFRTVFFYKYSLFLTIQRMFITIFFLSS